MKPIAVITNNIAGTMEYMKKNYDIVAVDMARKTLLTKEITYVLISSVEEALAWEFSGYIVAPNFITLIDVVRLRVR